MVPLASMDSWSGWEMYVCMYVCRLPTEILFGKRPFVHEISCWLYNLSQPADLKSLFHDFCSDNNLVLYNVGYMASSINPSPATTQITKIRPMNQLLKSRTGVPLADGRTDGLKTKHVRSDNDASEFKILGHFGTIRKAFVKSLEHLDLFPSHFRTFYPIIGSLKKLHSGRTDRRTDRQILL